MERGELRVGRLEPGESVLDALARSSGRTSHVLLRDVAEEHSPILRMPAPGPDEEASDDRRYQLLGEIARGGVGVVLKGRDKDLGREVAIKILRKRFADEPEVVERFIEEAQITGQLQNPGIVPVYDLGLQADGRPYFAMKMVKGRTLAALLEERAAASAERRKFLSVFEQICRTIAYAHARGVIHRDLKPSNVMLGAFGEVQVVDWGFAKVLGTRTEDDDLPVPRDFSAISTVRTGEGSSQSIAGSVMGTPAYMSPEQAMGLIDRLDERSDVFALGAILCEILTGEPPYTGEAKDLLIRAAQADLDEAFERLDACDAHPELVALTRRCLGKLRSDRPDDAGAVAGAVHAHLVGVEERTRRAELETAEARARAQAEQARLEREAAVARWERQARRRILLGATMLLLAIVLGGGGYLWVQRDREEQADRTMVAVREAEEEARLREGQERWDEAVAAAARAQRLASEPAIDAATRTRTGALFARLDARQKEVAAREEQARRDARFVDSLAEIAAAGTRNRDPHESFEQYRLAFEEHGLDPRDPAPSPAIRRAVWEALDDMEVLAEDKQPLRDALARLDADPARTRMRALASAGDADRLSGLATAEQPAASLALQGHLLLALDRIPRAVEVLDTGVERFPSDDRLLLRAADACERARAWDRASRHLTAALARRPTSIALRRRLGFALAYAGELDAALATISEVNLRGLDVDSYCQLGRILARKGDRDGAIEAFREAMRLDQRSPVPHFALGEALVESFHEYEAAIAAFQEARRLSPDTPPIHAALARTYLLHGDPKRAEQAIDHALGLDPESLDLQEQRATILAGQQRYGDAIAVYRRILAKDGKRRTTHFHLARAYVARGQYIAAAESVSRAQLEARWPREVHLLRAEIRERVGQFEAAENALLAAHRGDADDAEVECRLGRFYFERGQWERGLEHTRRGDERGRRQAGRWTYPSAEQLAEQERMYAAIRANDLGKPSVDLLKALFFAGRYADAARVAAALKTLDPGRPRLLAAAAAVRAGASKQARAWMAEEFAHWKPLLETGDPRAYRTVMDWQSGWLLRPVWTQNLDELPVEERDAWTKFWIVTTRALEESER